MLNNSSGVLYFHLSKLLEIIMIRYTSSYSYSRSIENKNTEKW